MRRDGALKIFNIETAVKATIFKGAKRTLPGTGPLHYIFELGKLISFALGILGLWHSSRNKSRFEFLNAKAIHLSPII